ncbi:MAG: hypothetical protein WAK55_09860, partial [Xanthobacteraceae bacterium]
HWLRWSKNQQTRSDDKKPERNSNLVSTTLNVRGLAFPIGPALFAAPPESAARISSSRGGEPLVAT